MNKTEVFDKLERKKDRYEKQAYDAAKPFSDKAKAVEAQIIAFLTDIKKGDTITFKRGRGTMRGVVLSIRRPYGTSLRYRVSPILKDGSVGRDTDVHTWHDPKTETPSLYKEPTGYEKTLWDEEAKETP